MIYPLRCRATNEAAVRHKHTLGSCRAVPSTDVLSPLVPDPLLRWLGRNRGGAVALLPRSNGAGVAPRRRCFAAE